MCQAGRKARKADRCIRDKESLLAGGAKRNSLKLNERTGNVYENKGPPLKTRERSGNVHENK
jgi:hypothetical protein